nr:hypothetical protein [Erwinia sp. Ejp617]
MTVLAKGLRRLGIEDGMPRFIASSLLSILLAVISYRYLEKKLSGSLLRNKKSHAVESRNTWAKGE